MLALQCTHRLLFSMKPILHKKSQAPGTVKKELDTAGQFTQVGVVNLSATDAHCVEMTLPEGHATAVLQGAQPCVRILE